MRLLNPLPTVALFGSLTFGLAGCPIWDDNHGNCYDTGCCDYYDDCYFDSCGSPADCYAGEVCGLDNVCHYGSCYDYGCAAGYVCDAKYECIPDNGSGGSGAGGSNVGGSGGFGGSGGAGGAGGEGGGTDVVWCANPHDCQAGEYCAPNGTCTPGDCSSDGCIFGFYCDTFGETPLCYPEDPGSCGRDAECGGNGNLCVSGFCTPPEDLCFDQTQCAAGDVCADGKCVPSCANAASCPSSFTCTQTVELCTTPATTCTITNDCGGPDSVCVDGACVPRAIDGICNDPNDVWVRNGCIPNQSATFVCTVDGSQDVCATGSLCLHHSCYISCETPNETACNGLPELDQCKSVTTTSGPHSVCGTADNLGDECDPTSGVTCDPGLICVDGYCK